MSVKGAKMIFYTVYIITIPHAWGSRLLENENKQPEKLKRQKSSLSWNYDEKYLFTFIALFELLKDMTFWYFNLTQCAGTKSFGIFYLSYKYIISFFTSKIKNKSKVSRQVPSLELETLSISIGMCQLSLAWMDYN